MHKYQSGEMWSWCFTQIFFGHWPVTKIQRSQVKRSGLMWIPHKLVSNWKTHLNSHKQSAIILRNMRLSEEEFLTYSFLNLFSILLKAAHTRHHKVPVPLVVYIGLPLGTIKRHLNIIETRFHVHNLTILLSRWYRQRYTSTQLAWWWYKAGLPQYASQSTRWIPLWSNKNYYITSIVPPPQYKFFKIHVSKMITRSCAYLQWDFFFKAMSWYLLTFYSTCSVERAFPCPWNRAPDSVCLASKPFYILPYALQEELAGISQKGFTPRQWP